MNALKHPSTQRTWIPCLVMLPLLIIIARLPASKQAHHINPYNAAGKCHSCSNVDPVANGSCDDPYTDHATYTGRNKYPPHD